MGPTICCGSLSGRGQDHRLPLPRGHPGGPWCPAGLHPLWHQLPSTMGPSLPTRGKAPMVDSGVPSPCYQHAYARTRVSNRVSSGRVALGEVGLDYAHSTKDWALQRTPLIRIMQTTPVHLPLVLHCREGTMGDAHSHLFQILAENICPHLVRRGDPWACTGREWRSTSVDWSARGYVSSLCRGSPIYLSGWWLRPHVSMPFEML